MIVVDAVVSGLTVKIFSVQLFHKQECDHEVCKRHRARGMN